MKRLERMLQQLMYATDSLEQEELRIEIAEVLNETYEYCYGYPAEKAIRIRSSLTDDDILDTLDLMYLKDDPSDWLQDVLKILISRD